MLRDPHLPDVARLPEEVEEPQDLGEVAGAVGTSWLGALR
jgi:hypothetical protein